jgi:hypothetical protein
MHVQQRCWSSIDGWEDAAAWSHPPAKTSLVFVFGPRDLLHHHEPIDQVRATFPNAQIVGCSTAGEISGTHVHDDLLVFTAIAFDQTQVRVVDTTLSDASDSFEAGRRLAAAIVGIDLVHTLVLSDGLHINGSELVKGLISELPPQVAVTGGLAGDGPDFRQTFVHLNGDNSSDRVVAIGLYGQHLQVGYGSRGGWAPFGPERIVTRSSGNVLYELDGESALSLYERYLGDHASTLPASALRFPLCVRTTLNSPALVRTILGINRQDQSMTFAGDIVQGTYARMMRADCNHLVEGASSAALVAQSQLKSKPADLAILISCVGRRLVMKQRTEEEVEAVREVVGTSAMLAGFYSYGEICPFGSLDQSALHNQTMTVTLFSEAG